MAVDLSKIKTEQRNEKSKNIDLLSTKEMLEIINGEDQKVALAVKEALGQIEKLVDKVVEVFENDGRLIYMGAGTSGRVGIVDAVECRPTFGVPHEMVQCLMAGGKNAFVQAVEGAEDSKTMAVDDLKNINLSDKDIVIGIAASGRTPYVIGGIEYAKEVGAATGCIVTSPNSPLAQLVEFEVEAITGEEVITGSTRLKSGTAQKMICNMISTASMIKIGHVYQNLMIDVLPTNEKLVARAINIIVELTGLEKDEAKKYYETYGNVKNALFASMSGIKEKEEVIKIMNENKQNLRKALESIK